MSIWKIQSKPNIMLLRILSKEDCPDIKEQYEMRISEAQPSEEHRIGIKLKHPYAVPAT